MQRKGGQPAQGAKGPQSQQPAEKAQQQSAPTPQRVGA
jgi:hypothetical protein